MSTFALDYDGTYTLDPEFWQEFVQLAEQHGHRVVMVTARYPDTEEVDDAPGGCRVYYTARLAKKPFMRGSRDGVPDVWIDDDPMHILVDHGTA